MTPRAPADRAGWARLMQLAGGEGRPHRRARHPVRSRRQGDRQLRQHLVGRGLHRRELPAGRAWLGQPRERGSRRTATATQGGCQAAIYLDTPGLLTKVHTWTPAAGPQYGYLVTHNEAISIADYYTDRRGRRAGFPADLPLCLPSLRPGGAVAARDARHRQGAGQAEDPRRERDPLGRRRARRAALRPSEERPLVRLAAVDPGDPTRWRRSRTPPACR